MPHEGKAGGPALSATLETSAEAIREQSMIPVMPLGG
jgi:hypothetical protein